MTNTRTVPPQLRIHSSVAQTAWKREESSQTGSKKVAP